ncbi:MAG TPA: ubiquinone/menaquinone biosynthesis methyltransferase, partial [Gaiellales bacterium]|nr:ubiquinone/menaquinone biosynthesis methyltransferase [Gaiellales bacterium]
MNLLMSMGCDGRWRRLGVRASGARPGDAALDVCCGTGDFAVELRRAVGPSGRVVGLDFSPQMLAMARRKSSAVEWLQGDALAIPFSDGEFAAACIGFGVRNLSDHRRGFSEMARVVRPGGRVVCLEMSTPPAPIRPFSQLWTDRGVPVLGRIVAHDPEAYRYLPESVHRFPAAPELAAIMHDAGLVHVGYRRLMMGVVALHVGTVPG